MQLMLDEKRFPASFAKLDRDKDGEISKHEWMLAIDLALEIRFSTYLSCPRRRISKGVPRILGTKDFTIGSFYEKKITNTKNKT